MLRPCHIQRTIPFHPIGNTPPVRLTQYLPPEQDASILLLGCGDVRNILYTAYTEFSARGTGDPRKLDITCCDIEVEIIARNIFILTMILEDTTSEKTNEIWSIYYDMQLNAPTCNRIKEHATTLLNLAGNGIWHWNDRRYGSIFRFVDKATFSLVVRCWLFYLSCANGSRPGKRALESGMEKAVELRESMSRHAHLLTSIRSAAPCSFFVMEDFVNFDQHYWKTGTTELDEKEIKRATRINPLFGTLNDSLTLHCGTNPLLGACLAAAYVPIADYSPAITTKMLESEGVERLIETAKAQFTWYCYSFRSISRRSTLRFVVSDALALCHVMQHHRFHGESESAHWYRDGRQFEPLVLNTEDYVNENSPHKAPLSFDMIDASDLIDQLGCINILASAAPLLIPRPTSTITTETLLMREETIDSHINRLLHSDLTTVALILGLSPIQTWTDSSMCSLSDEQILHQVCRDHEISYPPQFRQIVVWKSTACVVRGHNNNESLTSPYYFKIGFNDRELIAVFVRIYSKMFQDQSVGYIIKRGIRSIARKRYEPYTRASLVAILAIVKKSVEVLWEPFIKGLIAEICSERREVNINPHDYSQELFLYLAITGVHVVSGFTRPSLQLLALRNHPFGQGWRKLPPVICLTMIIPRDKISVFAEADTGSPAACLVVERRSGRPYDFPDIQIGFGMLYAIGERYSEGYKIIVDANSKGWASEAPMIVSTLVPTGMIMTLMSLSTEVSFRLKSSPFSSLRYMEEFGVFGIVHKSTLDSSDVFLTWNRPNMEGLPSICSFQAKTSDAAETSGASEASEGSESSDDSENGSRVDAAVTFIPYLDAFNDTRITQMLVRVDIIGEYEQDRFRVCTKVDVIQLSPFKLAITIDNEFHIQELHLPIPLDLRKMLLQYSRGGLYILIDAPVASREFLRDDPHSLFPVKLYRGKPEIGIAHYLNLDKLQKIHLGMCCSTNSQWLQIQFALMLSLREQREREKAMALGERSNDVRVNFKNSLIAMFVKFIGLEQWQCNWVFGINNSCDGCYQMLFFASNMRLDASNQTLVIDAAVYPLSMERMKKTRTIFESISQQILTCIKVDAQELLLWKNILPVLAERCRSWRHKPDCEYKKTGKIPISVEIGERIICSCGEGEFGDDFSLPKSRGLWNLVRRDATRVAIPLCFPVPHSQKPFRSSRPALLSSSESDEETGLDVTDVHRVETARNGNCAFCEDMPTEAVPLRERCDKCKVARYCCSDCQRRDLVSGKHQRICPILALHTK